MALRIGVNALYLIPGGVGGTEIYLRELLAALGRIDSKNEYFLFTNRETGVRLGPDLPKFHVVRHPVPAAIRPARLLWEQFVLPFSALRHGLDVLLNPGFTAPIFCAVPQVTVFHDLQHKRHPEHFRWFDLPFWRLFLFAAAHDSDSLIAVSQATRADLVHYYRLNEGAIYVVPHGVEPRFFTLDRSHIEPFLLCVATLHPHKNLDRLVRAFRRFHARRPEFRLVIAGLRGFFSRQLEELIDSFDLKEAVRLTGWIGREELYELYARAHAFVFPSTFEGFGLPVLEALAAGLPVACSNIAPLTEVAGDSALFFDPSEDAALDCALERVTADTALRESLSVRGPARAREFTWQRTAEQTLAVLRQTARNRRVSEPRP